MRPPFQRQYRHSMQIYAVKLTKFIPATCIFTAFGAKMCLRPGLRPRQGELSMLSRPLTNRKGLCCSSPRTLFPLLVSNFGLLGFSSLFLTVISGYAYDDHHRVPGCQSSLIPIFLLNIIIISSSSSSVIARWGRC